MSKLPRYEIGGRVPESDLRSLLRPAPPLVLEAAGEAGTKHSALAERYGQANAAAIAARAKLREAEEADQLAARQAVEKGAAIPKPKADAVRAKLEEAEREVQAISELVPASARQLLVAAAPVAGAVSEQASERANQLEESALESLAAVREKPSPWRTTCEPKRPGRRGSMGRGPSGRGRPRRRRALPSMRSPRRLGRSRPSRARRTERLAEIEYEKVALNALPLPGRRRLQAAAAASVRHSSLEPLAARGSRGRQRGPAA